VTHRGSWGGGACQVVGRRLEALGIRVAHEVQGEENKAAFLPPYALALQTQCCPITTCLSLSGYI
jgi:hypothetical protein